jgi:c-di-GMP-related signal transduction protein
VSTPPLLILHLLLFLERKESNKQQEIKAISKTLVFLNVKKLRKKEGFF